MSTTITTRAPAAPGPLSFAPFRRMFAARLVSSIGSTMQVVAAGWLVLRLTGSSMDVGLLAAVALGPSLVGSPIGGALADRVCPRKLATWLSAAQVPGPLLLALGAYQGWLTFPLILLFVLMVAVPTALVNPVMSIVVPFTVPEELRHRSVNLMSAARNVGMVIGGVCGGWATATMGAWLAFAVNGASNVLVAVVVAASPVLQASCDLARHRHAGRERSMDGLRDGLRAGWPLPLVRTVVYGALVFFVVVAPVQSLLPAIAREHGDAMMLGLLFATINAGAIIGNTFLGKVLADGHRARTVLVVGVLLSALGTLLVGAGPGLASDLLGLLVVGLSWEMVYVAGTSALQLDTPERIRGRMIGVFFLIVSAAAAAGALAMGWLFDRLGVSPALLAVAVVAAVGGAAVGTQHRRTVSASATTRRSSPPVGSVR
ncbi:MAG: MFS transporter [Microthrixaceae bacterium]